MDSDASLRCGIIGLGGIGHHHADRLTDLSSCRLAGGVDIAADARETFSTEYSVPSFETFEELVAHGVDAVIVTTPNKFHEQYAVAALDADIPVLCEKPLAHTVESAERIAEAAHDSDAFCMVGFNNRFTGAAERVVQARQSGRLGDISHVDGNYIRRRGVPGRGSWFTQKSVAGGGALIDIGVHAIDLALYLAGYPEVTEVSGRTRAQFGHREDYTHDGMWGEDHGADGYKNVDDSVIALLRCADGTTIALDVAWATNRNPSQQFVVRGTDSGAKFEMGESEVTFYDVNRADGADEPLPTPTVSVSEVDSHKAEQMTFIDAVAAGTPPERNTVEQALTVQRVIDAIYRSDDANRAVQLSKTRV